MADRSYDEHAQVGLDVSKSRDVIAIASKAQSEKVKEVLSRLESISKLDKSSVENLTAVLTASRADGGCGIGCW